MRKIIIDTSVVISALIQKNYPFFIIDELFFENKIELCISEYLNVLSRPKFNRFPDFYNNAQNILLEIGLKATLFKPKIKLDILKDKPDNMILELADVSLADFIITGNTNDFTISHYRNTMIVSPKDYWEFYKP